MMASIRSLCLGCGAAAALLLFASAASAQENLDLGKSPVELYASDCALCHKSPRGLSQGGGIFGLEAYLRQHYTASARSAHAIASYLKAVDRQAATEPTPRRPTRPAQRPVDHRKAQALAAQAKVERGRVKEPKVGDAAKSAAPGTTKSD